MKRKELCLLLGSMILTSMYGASLVSATEQHSTNVKHIGSKEGQEEYSVTVPAELNAGGESGVVKIEGNWKSTNTVNVTAPEEIIMTNSIDGEEQSVVINFDDIHQVGDNNSSIEVSKEISVNELTGAIFGEWTGTIVYSVTVTDSTGSEQHVHEWDTEYIVDQEATCDVDGSESIHCKGCSETKDSQVIAASGHSYVNDICDDCGAEVEYVSFTLTADNYTETGMTSLSGNVVIPGTFTKDGVKYKVESIGPLTFKNCTEMTSVLIPDTIKYIKWEAFKGCTGLTRVELPDSVETLSIDVFVNCTNLESIVIPDSVTSIGQYTFAGCEKLNNVTLPKNLTKISFGLFQNCTSLTSFTIPANVTVIAEDAFQECTALTKITFEDTSTWYLGHSDGDTGTEISVTNSSTNATNLVTTYHDYYWSKAD